MYCPSCSKEVVKGLIYCNHCGFKVSSKVIEARKSDLSSNSLISAIVSIFVIGFGCIVAFLAIMKNLGFNDAMTGMVILFSFVTIAAIEAVFMWLLIKRNRNHKEENEFTLPAESKKELYASPIRALAESDLKPVPSVVDSTTRTLEPVYRESITDKI